MGKRKKASKKPPPQSVRMARMEANYKKLSKKRRKNLPKAKRQLSYKDLA